MLSFFVSSFPATSLSFDLYPFFYNYWPPLVRHDRPNGCFLRFRVDFVFIFILFSCPYYFNVDITFMFVLFLCIYYLMSFLLCPYYFTFLTILTSLVFPSLETNCRSNMSRSFNLPIKNELSRARSFSSTFSLSIKKDKWKSFRLPYY